MPETKTTYLQDHQRTICPGCRFWLAWYRGRNGNQVNGCRFGVIPEKREGQWYCRQRKGTKQKGGETKE